MMLEFFWLCFVVTCFFSYIELQWGVVHALYNSVMTIDMYVFYWAYCSIGEFLEELLDELF